MQERALCVFACVYSVFMCVFICVRVCARMCVCVCVCLLCRCRCMQCSRAGACRHGDYTKDVSVVVDGIVDACVCFPVCVCRPLQKALADRLFALRSNPPLDSRFGQLPEKN